MSDMMKPWPRITIRSAMVAMLWFSVSFYFWSLDTRKTTANFPIEVLVLYGLRVVPLLVAIGTLFERSLAAFGIGCGLFILLAVVAILLRALAVYYS